MIALIKKAYDKYPDKPEYVKMMFRLQKNGYKELLRSMKSS